MITVSYLEYKYGIIQGDKVPQHSVENGAQIPLRFYSHMMYTDLIGINDKASKSNCVYMTLIVS